MSLSPNSQCCHSIKMLCYSKTCIIYDHTKRISVPVIFVLKKYYESDARLFCLSIYTSVSADQTESIICLINRIKQDDNSEVIREHPLGLQVEKVKNKSKPSQTKPNS